MAQITSIIKTGAGHWRIVVEKYNYSPKTYNWTSTTRWTHTTTDSMSIDDYNSDDESRSEMGEWRLRAQAILWGTKEIIR